MQAELYERGPILLACRKTFLVANTDSQGSQIPLRFCNRFHRCAGTRKWDCANINRQLMTRLAGRIRKARMSKGMSQRQLAICLGVTRGAVANWECTSAALPATERLQRIAQATGVAFEWLATGRGTVGYEAYHDETPAADLEIVEDPLELRLLRVFRAAPRRQHARIVAYLEAAHPRVFSSSQREHL